jgi:hypothetical protein
MDVGVYEENRIEYPTKDGDLLRNMIKFDVGIEIRGK